MTIYLISVVIGALVGLVFILGHKKLNQLVEAGIERRKEAVLADIYNLYIELQQLNSFLKEKLSQGLIDDDEILKNIALMSDAEDKIFLTFLWYGKASENASGGKAQEPMIRALKECMAVRKIMHAADIGYLARQL